MGRHIRSRTYLYAHPGYAGRHRSLFGRDSLSTGRQPVPRLFVEVLMYYEILRRLRLALLERMALCECVSRPGLWDAFASRTNDCQTSPVMVCSQQEIG